MVLLPVFEFWALLPSLVLLGEAPLFWGMAPLFCDDGGDGADDGDDDGAGGDEHASA